MGEILRGPNTLKLGLNTIAEVENIDVSYDVDSDDKKTVQGHTVTLYGAVKVSAKLTMLHSDVTSLAVLVPQNFVANGETLSSGEVVNDPDGAIDVLPAACSAAGLGEDLIIETCGDDGHIVRIMHCISQITGLSVDDKYTTVEVTLTGQSDGASIQIFRKGAISNVS